MDIISLKSLTFKNSEDDEDGREYFIDSGIALGLCGFFHPRLFGLEDGTASYELMLFKK